MFKQFVEKWKGKFNANKDKIIGRYVFVLLAYFIITFLPNITVSTPLAPFFNGGITKILFRAVAALAFFAYSAIVIYVGKITFKNRIVYAVAICTIILTLSAFINISTLRFEYINMYYELIVMTVHLGIIETFSFILDAFFGLFFFVVVFVVVPNIYEDHITKLRLVFRTFIFIMLGLSLISFIHDANDYKAIFTLTYSPYNEEGISSLFASKNAFGAFLMQAIMVSIFTISREKNRVLKVVFIASVVLFSFVMFMTLCKDAILGTLVFAFVCLIKLIKDKNNVKNIIGMIFIGILSAVFILFLLILFIEPLRKNIDLFAKIYQFFGANPVTGKENSVEGRFGIVKQFFSNIASMRVFIGYGQALPSYTYYWTFKTLAGTGNDNLHNSFLYVLGSGGIVYLGVYLYLIWKCFSNIFKMRVASKDGLYFSLIGILAGFMVYSFFETSVLFVSGSSGTMILSFILAPFIQTKNKVVEAEVATAELEVIEI